MLIAAALLASACTPPQTEGDTSFDMGPMPVVAAFYDSGPIQRDADWLSVWFTQEMAQAIAANDRGPEAGRLDYDFRSWANDSEVENIRYAVSEHPDGDADIITRFSYPGLPGGMHLTWIMCRRADGQWRIEDVAAIDVPDEASTAPAGETVHLRPALGLEPAAEGSCT
jgi:hypothetical protein